MFSESKREYYQRIYKRVLFFLALNAKLQLRLEFVIVCWCRSGLINDDQFLEVFWKTAGIEVAIKRFWHSAELLGNELKLILETGEFPADPRHLIYDFQKINSTLCIIAEKVYAINLPPDVPQ